MFKIAVQKKYILSLLLLVIPAMISLAQNGYFPMHDDIQGMRVLEMHKCILDFQIPCRWVPDMGFGYGYPQFNYYAPLPYYFMELAVLAGVGILNSVKFGFAASLIFSALGMYLLGSKIWNKTGGVISALFYTYAPYRAVDIYVRGAMGEAWAFVFLPFILLYTLEILEDNKKAILPLALSLAGLALSHNVTVIMFVPFYVLFVIIHKLNINKFILLSLAGVWGVSLSAFFTLPAFLEKEYVHVETILQGYFNYLAHFVGIKQLFFSTFWGYGSSVLGPLDGMALSVGILNWTLPVLVLLLFIYLHKVDDAKRALSFLVLSFIALFLIHPKSQIIWDNISLLAYIQFPWRFLAIAVLFFSIVVGGFGNLIQKNKKYFTLFSFLLLMLFSGNNFAPKSYLDITDSDKFSGESWAQQQTISIFDYLPKGAKTPPGSPAPMDPESDKITMLDAKKGTNWQEWRLLVSEDTAVTFPTFNFPVWKAKIDGEETTISSDNDLGLITLDLPKGEHLVNLNLANTPLRTISNIISVMALLLIPIYLKKYA